MLIKTCSIKAEKAKAWFTGACITRETLAKALAALLIATLIPLVVIALFNYPADDDFGFTLPAATAWVQTRSLGAVFQAVLASTWETYQTWQGYFVSTFLFALNPLIFNIKLYFLSNWAQLALLCLSVGYALKGVVRHALGASRAAFWIVYAAMMILCLQFMPYISCGVFWYNGGNYVTAVSTLLLILGLLLRLANGEKGWRRTLRGVLAPLLGFLFGGMFFGPMLAGFLMIFMVTVGSFLSRSQNRWQSLATLIALSAAFAISFLAPGNALRVGEGFASTGVPRAIFYSVRDALKLTGQWMSPQLLFMLLLTVPTLWQPLRDSRHRFAHALPAVILFFGVFAASLTTGVYTQVGYTFERYYNAVYLYFLIMVFGCAVYLEGALIRLLEKRSSGGAEAAGHWMAASRHWGERFSAMYLSVCLLMLLFGGLAFTLMNTASLSATRSLITGEAKTFRQEMEARAEYIRVTDSDVVQVKPLSVTVNVFKHDRLPFQGKYGTVRYMKWYYELFDNADTGS